MVFNTIFNNIQLCHDGQFYWWMFVCLFVCSMEIPDGCHLSTYMDGPYKVLVFGVDEISKMAVMARQV
jgi:hypothetical protein